MSVDGWQHRSGARRDPVRQVRVRRALVGDGGRGPLCGDRRAGAARGRPGVGARIAAHQRPPAGSLDHRGDRRRSGPADSSCSPRPKPDETLLVDDLGGWVTALLDPAGQPADDLATVADLAAAVRRERGPAGPGQPRGRAVAGAADAGRAGLHRRAGHDQPGGRRRLRRGWSLVVAGQPSWLKEPTAAAGLRRAAADAAPVAPAAPVVPVAPARAAEPVVLAARRPTRPRCSRRRHRPRTPTGRGPAGAAPDRADHDAAGAGHRPGHPARHGRCRCPTSTTPAAGPRPAAPPSTCAGAGLGALQRVVEFAAAHPGPRQPAAVALAAGACCCAATTTAAPPPAR